MTRTLSALAAAAFLTASSAHASPPACNTVTGENARCGEAGAMPFGWTPPDAILERQRELTLPAWPQLLSLAGLLGSFFALIALMPKFDGNWEAEEGDDDRRP